MTTINNLTIEQMREIVEGAPEGASHIRRGIYFKYRNPVEWYYWEENQWKFTSSDVTNSVFLINLDDLRTAITQYDSLSNSSGNEKQSDLSLVNESRDFKVGDFVVLNQSHSQDRVLKIQMFHEDFIRAFVGDSIKYSFGHKTNFRRATPEEIKAGHRLEAERHG